MPYRHRYPLWNTTVQNCICVIGAIRHSGDEYAVQYRVPLYANEYPLDCVWRDMGSAHPLGFWIALMYYHYWHSFRHAAFQANGIGVYAVWKISRVMEKAMG